MGYFDTGRASELAAASYELDEIKKRLQSAGLPPTGNVMSALLSLCITTMVARGFDRERFLAVMATAFDMATRDLRNLRGNGDA